MSFFGRGGTGAGGGGGGGVEGLNPFSCVAVMIRI